SLRRPQGHANGRESANASARSGPLVTAARQAMPGLGLHHGDPLLAGVRTNLGSAASFHHAPQGLRIDPKEPGNIPDVRFVRSRRFSRAGPTASPSWASFSLAKVGPKSA